MRADFILKFHEDLKQAQINGVPDAELRAPIEDMGKFMREDSEDLEKNHLVIGMKHLLRGFSIKAWKGTNFSGNKCKIYKRIVNQHCMNYYCKYCQDINETLHYEVVKGKEW